MCSAVDSSSKSWEFGRDWNTKKIYSNILKYFNLYHSQCKIQHMTKWRYFLLFFFSSRNHDSTFHAKCLHSRQFAWNVKSGFLGKIRKNISKCHLLTILPRVLSVNSFPPSGNFCLLLITFVNSLDIDQAQQNFGPDLDPNCLMVFLKDFFFEKVNLKKIHRQQKNNKKTKKKKQTKKKTKKKKNIQNYPACKQLKGLNTLGRIFACFC